MKVRVEECRGLAEPELIVRCRRLDAALAGFVEQLRRYPLTIAAEKDGRVYAVAPPEIFYIEAVDAQTFLYRADDVLRTQKRLYVLEQELADCGFLRVSKSCMLNLQRLQSVAPQFDGRMEAHLENGEIVTVNRRYVKAFKKAFGL